MTGYIRQATEVYISQKRVSVCLHFSVNEKGDTIPY